MAKSILPWAKPLAKRVVQLAPGLGGTLTTREIQHIRTIGDKNDQTPEWLTDNTREKYIAEFEDVKKKNKEWSEEMRANNPEFFEKQDEGQGLGSGQIFVHRNIANLVVNTDMNMLSVLEYAVAHLKVRHIIVCGHYQCGGVKAATSLDQDLGVIEHWLRNVRDVQRLHMTELMQIMDPEVRYRRLVELNVAEQCINLFKTGVVQQSRNATGLPLIHGLVYEIKDGLLKELNLDLMGYMKQYKGVYKLYSQY